MRRACSLSDLSVSPPNRLLHGPIQGTPSLCLTFSNLNCSFDFIFSFSYKSSIPTIDITVTFKLSDILFFRLILSNVYLFISIERKYIEVTRKRNGMKIFANMW